jgi:peptidoglycan hydrolase-like protein with peptidoglycan-binding domain
MATSGRAGYGTLLHEMIHALIAADFPNAPAWLNEGLASLYERTQWSNSQLHALPNWRMDGLRESNMPSLADLVQQASEIGLHSHEIAAIRLLFLYLDQQNLMDDLYLLAKQGSPDFTLSQGVTSLGLMEAGWQEFLKETFSSYRAELARNKGALSHPDEIRFVQQALKQTVNPGIKVDGHWGQQTRQALMEFQRQNGLDDDGILGPKTASTLREVYQKSRVLSGRIVN